MSTVTKNMTGAGATRAIALGFLRKAALPLLSLSAFALVGCSSFEPPHIAYDDSVPPLKAPPVPADDRPKPLHIPPAWKPALGGKTGASEAKDPEDRVDVANDAARVQPRRGGYFNAVQVYPFSASALYQVYASPGQITDVALEQGEQLTGSGPVAAGDTVRWVIGDTESGAGEARRVHILVKPTRPGIDTNLVLNTDRRTYLLELRSREKRYMPSIAWTYPTDRAERARNAPLTPVLPDPAQRRLRYSIEGDDPPWRPLNAYDDGRKVYVEFPGGISQGEMPPLFVLGSGGKAELVNYRAYGNLLIVDRLFAAAELRLGSDPQQKVRILRTDGRPSS